MRGDVWKSILYVLAWKNLAVDGLFPCSLLAIHRGLLTEPSNFYGEFHPQQPGRIDRRREDIVYTVILYNALINRGDADTRDSEAKVEKRNTERGGRRTV